MRIVWAREMAQVWGRGTSVQSPELHGPQHQQALTTLQYWNLVLNHLTSCSIIVRSCTWVLQSTLWEVPTPKTPPKSEKG